MSNKKTYKILALTIFVFTAVGIRFLEPVTVIGGFLIAIYCTLCAILAHMEERDG